MTTTTPNLNLILYNSTTDQSATFAAFRADMAGISGTSNFSKIDTAFGTLDGRVDTLELIKSAILINANFISSNYYEATTALMTAYTTGMSILLNLDTDSAGTVTLKINALSTLSVMKIDSTGTPVNIAGGELQAGRYYLFIYDGTRWVWADATSADQVHHGGTIGNLVTVASDGSMSSSIAPATQIATSINSATAKTIPVDADEMGILDSAASFVLKKITWANIKAAFLSYWYSIFDGWIPSTATWTYSSIDGATGIASVNADMTGVLQKGMRLGYQQLQALTAYWSFDTNSNSDVGSFNGTDTSMTYTAGKFSNAATFNGTTSKIVLTDTANLKPTGDFTLGFWLKSSSATTQGLFQSYSANTNTAGFETFVVSNVIAFRTAKNTGTTIGLDYTQINSTTNVLDGNWHYIVMTYRNNYGQLYVDGALEAFGYMFAPAYAATNYVRIGCLNQTGTDNTFANGQIDDLFLINGYALDEKTIRDKYLASTAQGTGNITIQKMAIITSVGAYSGGNTLITSWGGTDFSLVNATISSPKYSNVKVPFGFNANTDKWSVYYRNIATVTKTSPTTNVWYNTGDGGVVVGQIVIPIGYWNGYYQSIVYGTTTAAQSLANLYCTLSDANNTESDISRTVLFGMVMGASGTWGLTLPMNKELTYNLSVKSTQYFNIKGGGSFANINMGGSISPLEIKLISGYL